MSVKKIITTSAIQTQKRGFDLAKEVLKLGMGKKAVIFGLKGNLGSAKTTFLQGFAKGLGIKEKVLSPTFVIFKRFKIKDKSFKNFYHFDCYRIQNLKELNELGFKEIEDNPENIIAVEWPEIIEKKSKIIEFKFVSPKKRQITLNGKIINN